MQDDEIANLRTKLADLERSKEGVPAIGQEAHDRYTLERLKKDLADPQQDPQKGTGVIELDTAVETMQRKIIKWTPNTNTVTLEGHTDGVACLAHSVEYKKLFSGSLDRSIRVWDLSFHEPLCDGELKGHRGGITGMAISKQKLVSGSADMTVRVWDLLQMREETKLAGHSGPIHGLILLNDMCLTVSQDKSIKIWDIRAGELVTSIETKSRGQYGMAIHELKLISASGSKIYTWDLRKVASSTMNEQQRMEFGRFDTLTGNASGVFGHQMVGDRLYTSAGSDKETETGRDRVRLRVFRSNLKINIFTREALKYEDKCSAYFGEYCQLITVCACGTFGLCRCVSRLFLRLIDILCVIKVNFFTYVQ